MNSLLGLPVIVKIRFEVVGSEVPDGKSVWDGPRVKVSFEMKR